MQRKYSDTSFKPFQLKCRFRLLVMLLLILIGACFNNVESHFYESNVTDLSRCKVHYSRTGSVYKDFYDIERAEDQDDTLLVDFHFAVMAPSDAHILMASSAEVNKDEPVYEIVIGAGGNSFCDIRRKQKSEVKASVRLKGMISALDPISFWIHISKEGNVDVGKEGEELPFISWIDPDPLPIKVISFSTWSGIEAKWYFDCERQKQTKEVEKNMTHTEKLRRDLLYHYDPYVRPVQNISTITVIKMGMAITHVTLDEHNAIIDVQGEMQMAWHDEKLHWDPSVYGSLEKLHIFRREIWQPSLKLFNTVGAEDILGDNMMIVSNNGTVEWSPPVNMKTWCDPETMGMWPAESHNCSLILGSRTSYYHVVFDFMENDVYWVDLGASEWSVEEIDIYYGKLPIAINKPSAFELKLTLKRISTMYNRIFFTPFFVLAASVLATFWVDPVGQLKITLCCFQLILTTIILIVLGQYAPRQSDKVPYLVLLYSYSLVAELIATAISISVINMSRNQHIRPLPHILRNILSARVIAKIIFPIEVQAKDKSNGRAEHQKLWMLIGASIDRLSFLIYLVLVVYAIYMF